MPFSVKDLLDLSRFAQRIIFRFHHVHICLKKASTSVHLGASRCFIIKACVFLTDSSQSESLSDAEDQRPSFSRPSASQNASNSEESESATKFSMYNHVSQKLMVMHGYTLPKIKAVVIMVCTL